MVEDLIKRLREQSQGRVKWFAMNKDESAYFIDFHTTWEAGEWMERQKKHSADWLEREGVHMVEKRIFTELEELAKQAADALEQQSALESERDALLAAAGKEAGAEVVGSQEICWVRVTSNGLKPGDKLYTAPTAALENGDGRDAWISVDERMPENDQIVAFVVKADQESPNWYLNGHVLGGTYHENWGFSTPGVGHRASHWMPLPAAPAALSQKAGEQH